MSFSSGGAFALGEPKLKHNGGRWAKSMYTLHYIVVSYWIAKEYHDPGSLNWLTSCTESLHIFLFSRNLTVGELWQRGPTLGSPVIPIILRGMTTMVQEPEQSIWPTDRVVRAGNTSNGVFFLFFFFYCICKPSSAGCVLNLGPTSEQVHRSTCRSKTGAKKKIGRSRFDSARPRAQMEKHSMGCCGGHGQMTYCII